MKKSTAINRLFLCVIFLYLWIVQYAQFFLWNGFSQQPLLLGMITVIAALVTAVIKHFAHSGDFQWDCLPITPKAALGWFAGIFALSLAYLSIFYFAYFPGAFSGDSVDQLQQATSSVYSDWHPVIHTLLFFTLPMKLFQRAEMIVLLQIIYFSLALAYLTVCLRKSGCPVLFCIIQVFFVLAAPATVDTMLYPWKDSALAIFAMVIMGQYIMILSTKGHWLKKKTNIFLFSAVLAVATMLRHNAILFTAPLLLSLIVNGWQYRKKFLSVILLFCCVFGLVKGPVYAMLDVEKPGNRVIEVVGLPMTILGNAVVQSPDSLDPPVRQFLYEIADAEEWEKAYVPGHYNAMKWSGYADNEVIEKAGVFQVLKYTAKAMLSCPEPAFQAFLLPTGMIWALDGLILWECAPTAASSLSEIHLDYARQSAITNAQFQWKEFTKSSILKYPFWYIGWMMLALIFCLARIHTRKDLKHILHIVPLLCHNFGTALLLTGYDWRFFYFSFPVILPTLYITLRETNTNRIEVIE